MGIYPEPVGTWTGAAQGYEAFGLRDTLGVKFESINVPPEIAMSRLPGAGRRFAAHYDRMPHFANWAVALRADGEGSVRPSRFFGGDIVRYALTQRDLERLRGGLRRLAEMHFLAGAKEVFTGIYGLPESITRIEDAKLFDEAPLDPRVYTMVATHLFGTCRASSDPGDSVCDPHLRVRGVDGLYVMDASVFPTNTGVNPQHSIMAIAIVAARRLAAA
jgi:choline dehydrogenase-like flavoprotein